MPKEYDISKAFKRIENDLIDSMMRNMKRHQVEEAELGIQWEQWQALQLQELERFKAENKDLFTERFDEINDAIDDLFYATYRDARAAEEHRIIDRIKKGDFTPPEDKGGFFGLNEAKLKALLVATRNDMVRAEFALLRRANDQYRQIIFDSMAYANVTNDYRKAVDMATKDFLRSGINCVQYKNGARHTIESYASMAIRTGNKRAYLMGEGEAHDRYGIHTVRVNKRPDACPKCVAFLGRILVDDVYGGGTQAEATKLGVPTLSDAMLSGFLHPNCKDTYSAYIEGVSKPADSWTPQEIEDIVDDYNLEQEIKRAQDTADTYNRMAKYSLDDTNKANYTARAKEWEHRVSDLQWRRIKGAAGDAEELTPVYHEGIRKAIDVKDGTFKTVGLHKVDGDILSFSNFNEFTNYRGEAVHTATATLSKQIKLQWGDLSDQTQARIRWDAPARYGKEFLIQKNDLKDVRLDRNGVPSTKNTSLDFVEKSGYKYKADGYIRKYNTLWWYSILEKDGAQYLLFESADVKHTISDSTIKAINAREKIVSQKLWDEGVRFRNLTARKGDEWVHAMTKFHTAVEADKPVNLVSKEVYDNIKGKELYRGIAPVSHLRSDITMSKTPLDCARQLMEGGVGDCFPSRGIYGDCIAYLSDSKDVAFNYATGYKKGDAGGAIIRMKIKDDAKVITYNEARELFNQIADTMGENGQPYFSRKQVNLTRNVEVGKAMQMLGYDVIYEPRGDGMNVGFYMVLNRDAIVSMKDNWLEASITQEMLRKGHL